jgi:flagellar hook-length control protein FliK
MQIDLIEALSGQAAAVAPASDAATSSGFPQILQSELVRESPRQEGARPFSAESENVSARGESGERTEETRSMVEARDATPQHPDPARDSSAEDASREAGTKASADDESARASRSEDLPDEAASERESHEQAAASGALAAAASVLVDPARRVAAQSAEEGEPEDESAEAGVDQGRERARASAGEADGHGIEQASRREEEATGVRASEARATAEAREASIETPEVTRPESDSTVEGATRPDHDLQAATRSEAAEQPARSDDVRNRDPVMASSATTAGVPNTAVEHETGSRSDVDPTENRIPSRPETLVRPRADGEAQASDTRSEVAERAESSSSETTHVSARVEENAALERGELERSAEEAALRATQIASAGAAETREASLRAPQTTAVDGVTPIANPVAGMMTETTPSAPPGIPTPVAAAETIAVQTEWLATRGGGTARLVLHPPELGEMAIRVTLRAGAVDVVVVAQEHAAADIADKQANRLAQAFAGRDLRLEHFEVRRGEPDGLGAETGGRFAQSGSGEERQGGSEEGRPTTSRALPGLSGDGTGIQAVPRIATVAAARGGVDLRI